MTRREIWLQVFFGPARFWLGVAFLLVVVGGISYTYGAWYASVLTLDAVPVRQLQERASWPGQFEYSEDNSGMRRRVRRPAPVGLTPHYSVDYLDEIDITAGGYVSYGQALRVHEMRLEQEEEEEQEEQQTQDRSAYLQAMRDTGLLTGEQRASGRSHTVVVDEYGSQSEARAAAGRLRELGRPVNVEQITGDDGSVSYRVQSGSFPSVAEAQAYQRELEQAGVLEGGGSTAGTGAPPDDPTPPADPVDPPTDPVDNGGSTRPPPTDPLGPDPGPVTPPDPGPADIPPVDTAPGPTGPGGAGETAPPPAGEATDIAPPPVDPIPPPGAGGGRELGDL